MGSYQQGVRRRDFNLKELLILSLLNKHLLCARVFIFIISLILTKALQCRLNDPHFIEKETDTRTIHLLPL